MCGDPCERIVYVNKAKKTHSSYKQSLFPKTMHIHIMKQFCARHKNTKHATRTKCWGASRSGWRADSGQKYLVRNPVQAAMNSLKRQKAKN